MKPRTDNFSSCLLPSGVGWAIRYPPYRFSDRAGILSPRQLSNLKQAIICGIPQDERSPIGLLWGKNELRFSPAVRRSALLPIPSHRHPKRFSIPMR